MSIGLENLVNVSAANSDYPNGDITDDTGAGDGTPLDQISHSDYHQTFREFLTLAGITPNGLPDNVTNGYQYIEAMQKVLKNYIGVLIIDATTSLTASDSGKLIIVSGTTADIDIFLPASATLIDGDNFLVFNNGDYNVSIRRTVPDNFVLINGSALTLNLTSPRDFAECVLDKANTDWYVPNLKITPKVKTVLSNTLGAAEVGAAATAIFLFESVQKNVYSTYDAVTGKFTPNVAGWYEVNVTSIFNIAASISNYTIEMALFKNGVLLKMLHTSYPYNGNSQTLNMDGNYIFEANGTTDYFEIRLNTYNPQTWAMKGHVSYKFLEE